MAKIEQTLNKLIEAKQKEEKKTEETLAKLKEKFDADFAKIKAKYEADVAKVRSENEAKLAELNPEIAYYDKLLKEQQKLEAMQKDLERRFNERKGVKEED